LFGTVSVTGDSLQTGISVLQVISQGSCAFADIAKTKAESSSKVLNMMVLFLILVEIGCKNRKFPKMNATCARLLFQQAL
jgi:hypothetical protein